MTIEDIYLNIGIILISLIGIYVGLKIGSFI